MTKIKQLKFKKILKYKTDEKSVENSKIRRDNKKMVGNREKEKGIEHVIKYHIVL
jgi:hypothetical protein